MLHIISARRDPAGADPEGCDAAILACAAQAAPSDMIVLLATRRQHQRAALLGLRPHLTLAPPLGREELACAALGRRLRAGDGPARVVAWGSRTARLARLLGLDAEVSTPDSWSIPPFQKCSVSRRLAIRRALGIDDHAAVFLSVAEPAGRFDAFFALRMLSLLDVAGRPIVGLFPSGAASFDRARRFHRDVGLSMGVIVREEPWWLDAAWTDFAVLAPRSELCSPATAGVDRVVASALLGQQLPTLIERSFARALGLAGSDPEFLITGRSDGHAALAKRTLQLLLDRAPDHVATNRSGRHTPSSPVTTGRTL